MLALNAGKNVLCEKAFTVNAAQAKILYETARQKNLFLMEAVWTRYFPLSVQVREIIRSGEIGEVLRTVADTSFGDDVEEKWGTTHRMVNPDLAGGALLDCKCYCCFYRYTRDDGSIDIDIVCSILTPFFYVLQWASTPSPGSSKPSTTPSQKTNANHQLSPPK